MDEIVDPQATDEVVTSVLTVRPVVTQPAEQDVVALAAVDPIVAGRRR